MGSEQLLIGAEPKKPARPKRFVPVWLRRICKLAANLGFALCLVFLLWFLLINFGPKRKVKPVDPIEAQNRFVPDQLYDGFVTIFASTDVNVKEGLAEFEECPVKNCVITKNESDISIAKAVITTPRSKHIRTRPRGQVWILSLMESPANTPDLSWFMDKVNYTASYRMDSDFPTPYGYVKHSRIGLKLPKKDYSALKSKSILWLASNCLTHSGRERIVDRIARFTAVDVLGECGAGRISQAKGFDLMNNVYRFYLAFENSQCPEYVTEKLFNALRNNIVPIVYGEEKSFYEKIAPPHSFIHLDDFEDTRSLANYLKYLSGNSSAYNAYFNWKRDYYLSESKLHCRVCAALQKPKPRRADLSQWTHGCKQSPT